ncbi:HEPN domain-containing protein [Stutzerimonas stutzeri]|uniref:HEPN domain-containing protein n=1 Tax=Stutzerimonas stutzeri TaxID=316 RepID=UPI001185325B|nr:HEPN domain-containing protein [Stutzerimonas stutzeri]MCQ4331875.1 HEPN domain-containing protein [Stutzerimonas stutzeri]
MYKELRGHRQLGQRGRLTPQNEDLLWLPRSAVVTSLSALDAYVHAVLKEQIPQALRMDSIPPSLCDAMASIIPIKSGANFREAIPIISAANIYLELSERLNEKTLSFLSYQAPEKIIAGYDLIGHQNVFESVSQIWSGPNTSASDLKRILANYVKRRNQIAHEGDREANGAIRHMQPAYANKCSEFIENLVSKLNRVVYGI